ncbi:MAG TPA: 4-(cytidine 5'-diphospho)-2-C-methyl-D-erythritol kinase [Tepidisphaeraceae bacterium]|jgi:4-diphosphocytidyl-2-C-methyl-D-erythritol kinase|nr:4-(cytidine 5'-diphospho)-2-C-methyl-D-erythritol kinase [Tepidisphaeraceae bacterium]
MRLLCPAKINLHLRVGPRRDDGFHSLLSWFCTAGLFDTLTFEHFASPAEEPRPPISLVCDRADIPCDGRNLVVKVAVAWAQEVRNATGVSVGGIRASLQKRIPAGAGLGGGSSDGARALLGLNALWRTNRSADDLSEFAGRFGSDLPFFFHGPSNICTGRGENVRPLAKPSARWVLLILPPIHMPTADVYRRFDAMHLGRDEDISVEPTWATWAKLDAKELMEQLVNDLEPPAFAISPALAALRQDIETALAQPVRMSGSGSSLFTLYDTKKEATAAGGQIEQLCERGQIEIVELAPEFKDDVSTQIDDRG